MKRYATFFVIAVQTLGLGFVLVTRDRPKHDAPAAVVEVTPAVADAGPDAAPLEDAAAVASSDAGGASPPGDAPVRVASLGWELVAPGVAITLPDGGPPPPPAPPIELAPETSLEAVEARLARGGADPQGADVAVLPLPAFVASFERLRALEPRVFLVVGFSHGREEVRAAPGALLAAPPAADEVRMVALGPQTAADPSAQASGSESATLLGLFTLDLLGVAPSRVRLVAPGSADAKTALVAAIVSGASDDRKLAFTSADASRLVPIVAVAPKSVIDTREPALREWSKAWLDGLARGAADVPGLARRLASKEALPLAAGVGGAPEALVLVARLGRVDGARLDQQTSLLGPLAVGPVTLDTLTQQTWQLSRGAGIVSSAAPEPLPIDARVVSMIASPPKPAPPPPAADGDAGAAFGPIPPGSVPLVTYRATEGDADAVAARIHFLAGIFERHAFRIAAKGGAKAAAAIATAARDKGVPASRLATVATEPRGVFASVEILSPP